MKKKYSLNKFKKNKKKAILFLSSIFICSLIFNNFGIYNYVKFWIKSNQLLEMQNKLTIEENALREKIELLQSDSAYIKNLIREKLKMVDPGEKFFLIQKK